MDGDFASKGVAILHSLLLLFFLGALSLEAASIQTQINTKSGELKESLQKERTLSQKLETLGAEVNKQNQKITQLEKSIQEAGENIAKNEGEFKEREKELGELERRQEEIEQAKREIEQQLLEVIAQDVSFVMILNDHHPKSAEDLVFEEVFKALSQEMKKRVDGLTLKQSELAKESQRVGSTITGIKKFIQAENEKRRRLDEMKKNQKELVASLAKEMKEYDAELKRVVQERESLKEILAKLNITKEQEEAKRRAKEATSKKSDPKEESVEGALEVRQVATSYHDVSTVKYTGERTIPPLERFEIERKFGPYYDPVYKMKVFNESVIFNALESDAKVRSVMDGKVVFAKETPMLKRVVIIEHKNSLHTIYAHLDKIAPTIKPGSPVKKGYIIGRTDGKLMFEVTQKDRHIDPMEFITVK